MTPDIKTKRLLVVEDSQDLQELTKELFETEGYEVYCSSNGQEALNFLRGESPRPDLILLDLMMPVMDGYEFRKVQMQDTDLAAIPVVVITADADAREKAGHLKANDYASKAEGIDSLLDVVKRNCNNPQ